MNFMEVQENARRLFDAHGDKAEAEAAQKARELEDKGDNEQAGHWRRIRDVIAQMRGPHES